MGYTTSIPEPELERGDGPPPCEGYDIEAEAAKTKSKKVEPKEEKPPVTSTASTKAKSK